MLGIFSESPTKLGTWDAELSKQSKVSALIELTVMVRKQKTQDRAMMLLFILLWESPGAVRTLSKSHSPIQVYCRPLLQIY